MKVVCYYSNSKRNVLGLTLIGDIMYIGKDVYIKITKRTKACGILNLYLGNTMLLDGNVWKWRSSFNEYIKLCK